MKDFFKRAGWALLAGLFLITGLGVGLLAFWQATHPAKNTQNTSTSTTQSIKCADDPSIQFNTSTGSAKLAGAKLSDYTPLPKLTAVECTDVKVGTIGQAVASSSSITANYTGAVAATGVIFQSSLDNNGQPFTTAISGVIPGWQEGLLGMKAGGERRLFVPAALAYGANPPAGSGIPANADLVFDVSVIAVQ